MGWYKLGMLCDMHNCWVSTSTLGLLSHAVLSEKLAGHVTKSMEGEGGGANCHLCTILLSLLEPCI